MTTSGNDHSAAVNSVSESSADTGSRTVTPEDHHHVAQNATAPGIDLLNEQSAEHGGQAGLEPTRYGDWEKKGRCTDF